MRLRTIMVGLAAIVFGAVLFSGAAYAGEEKACASQYSLEEQLILEWAALGGDPHAQFAMAQCAFPEGAGDLSQEEKSYAYKWVTLATCDTAGSAIVEARDQLTRKLKANGDLSYRRFGDVKDSDDFSRREKRFLQYRAHKSNQLMKRAKRLQKMIDGPTAAQVRADLAIELSRVGPIGRLRLAGLTSCEQFAASDTLTAAAWAAAAEVWSPDKVSAVYGKRANAERSISDEARARATALSSDQLATFAYERAELTRFDEDRIDAIESEAALARLGELRSFRHVDVAAASGSTGGDGSPVNPFVGASVTMATQYALEALGFMDFVNGPDNDYGPSTIEAVGAAQTAFGVAPTRWLSHGEVRDMVCTAATRAKDPVSYYHLATMFMRGIGYQSHLVKARHAMDQAEALIEMKMVDPATLPEWKAKTYPVFQADIMSARGELDRAWLSLPAHAKNKMSSWTPDQPLCN